MDTTYTLEKKSASSIGWKTRVFKFNEDSFEYMKGTKVKATIPYSSTVIGKKKNNTFRIKSLYKEFAVRCLDVDLRQKVLQIFNKKIEKRTVFDAGQEVSVVVDILASSPFISMTPLKNEGYLLKEGSFRKTWKRRFFRLSTTSLDYHFPKHVNNIENVRPIARILLKSILSIRKHVGTKGDALLLCCPSRTYHIVGNKDELKDWLLKITTNIRCLILERTQARMSIRPPTIVHQQPLTPSIQGVDTNSALCWPSNDNTSDILWNNKRNKRRGPDWTQMELSFACVRGFGVDDPGKYFVELSVTEAVANDAESVSRIRSRGRCDISQIRFQPIFRSDVVKVKKGPHLVFSVTAIVDVPISWDRGVKVELFGSPCFRGEQTVQYQGVNYEWIGTLFTTLNEIHSCDQSMLYNAARHTVEPGLVFVVQSSFPKTSQSWLAPGSYCMAQTYIENTKRSPEASINSACSVFREELFEVANVFDISYKYMSFARRNLLRHLINEKVTLINQMNESLGKEYGANILTTEDEVRVFCNTPPEQGTVAYDDFKSQSRFIKHHLSRYVYWLRSYASFIALYLELQEGVSMERPVRGISFKKSAMRDNRSLQFVANNLHRYLVHRRASCHSGRDRSSSLLSQTNSVITNSTRSSKSSNSTKNNNNNKSGNHYGLDRSDSASSVTTTIVRSEDAKNNARKASPLIPKNRKRPPLTRQLSNKLSASPVTSPRGRGKTYSTGTDLIDFEPTPNENEEDTEEDKNDNDDNNKTACLMDVITVGAPAAHVVGFEFGGLSRWRTALEQLVWGDDDSRSSSSGGSNAYCHAFDNVEKQMADFSAHSSTGPPDGSTLMTVSEMAEMSMALGGSNSLSAEQKDNLTSTLKLKYLIRKDVVMSQALAALMSSFLSRLELMLECPLNDNRKRVLLSWFTVGFPLGWESLLSTEGKEKGMLEDMIVGVEELANVHIVFVSESTVQLDSDAWSPCFPLPPNVDESDKRLFQKTTNCSYTFTVVSEQKTKSEQYQQQHQHQQANVNDSNDYFQQQQQQKEQHHQQQEYVPRVARDASSSSIEIDAFEATELVIDPNDIASPTSSSDKNSKTILFDDINDGEDMKVNNFQKGILVNNDPIINENSNHQSTTTTITKIKTEVPSNNDVNDQNDGSLLDGEGDEGDEEEDVYLGEAATATTIIHTNKKRKTSTITFERPAALTPLLRPSSRKNMIGQIDISTEENESAIDNNNNDNNNIINNENSININSSVNSNQNSMNKFQIDFITDDDDEEEEEKDNNSNKSNTAKNSMSIITRELSTIDLNLRNEDNEKEEEEADNALLKNTSVNTILNELMEDLGTISVNVDDKKSEKIIRKEEEGTNGDENDNNNGGTTLINETSQEKENDSSHSNNSDHDESTINGKNSNNNRTALSLLSSSFSFISDDNNDVENDDDDYDDNEHKSDSALIVTTSNLLTSEIGLIASSPRTTTVTPLKATSSALANVSITRTPTHSSDEEENEKENSKEEEVEDSISPILNNSPLLQLNQNNESINEEESSFSDLDVNDNNNKITNKVNNNNDIEDDGDEENDDEYDVMPTPLRATKTRRRSSMFRSAPVRDFGIPNRRQTRLQSAENAPLGPPKNWNYEKSIVGIHMSEEHPLRESLSLPSRKTIVTVQLPTNFYNVLRKIGDISNPISVEPMLFTQGINEKQTVANISGSGTSLQDKVNKKSLKKLKKFVAKSLDVQFDSSYVNKITASMDALVNSFARHSSKNFDILQKSADVIRLLGGGRCTSCKSAKDRTSMSVTLEAARVLQDEGMLLNNRSNDSTRHCVGTLRGHGVRLANCRKNVGKPKFAFNSLQRSLLPRAYRPPKYCSGNNRS